MTENEGIDEKIEAEAAAWFTTMHSGDADKQTRARFEGWLHGDRAHKIAYREYEQVYRDVAYAAVEAGVDLDRALERNRRGPVPVFSAWIGRPAFAGMIALAGLAGLVAVAFVAFDFRGAAPAGIVAPDFATKTAEIREITLEDSTVVTLGAKSQIAAEYTSAARKVTLLEGEAFFEVAKDPARPFYVTAQDTLVRVVGTKFDVKRSAGIVHVSVLEGVVEVMKPDNIERAIETTDADEGDKQVLTAGERVSAARRVALPEARQVNQAPPGAWREGRLAYEDASLAEIVSDLNRYYDRPIRIATSDVGDLRSTVAFNTSEIAQVFDVMEAIQPVEIDRSASGEIVIRRRR